MDIPKPIDATQQACALDVWHIIRRGKIIVIMLLN